MNAVLALKETVKTNEDPPPAASAAVPVGLPDDGAVNVRAAVPEDASARPAPLSVMRILPLFATCDAGVSVTLMVTVVAPLATLLSVIAGCARKGVPARMAGNVTKLTPSMLLFVAEKVEMVTPVVAAAAAAAFLSPANRHTIDEAVAVAGVVTLSTRVLEPDSDAAPTERPLQVREPVG